MTTLYIAARAGVLVLMLASARWTYVARRGRYMTDPERSSAHFLAITFALWAIDLLLAILVL